MNNPFKTLVKEVKNINKLQADYAKKDALYNHTLGRLAGVKAGSPRKLKYKYIVFSNLASKQEWVHTQESTLQKLCDVMKRLSKRIHVSQVA